jgi:uncharacterized repeat protein (TIGR03847 family)
MNRQVFDYPAPDRFVAGTVGQPGERIFFLQARQGPSLTSVALEKSQAAMLAERIDQLLDEARGRGHHDIIPEAGLVSYGDTAPLDVPIVEEFRVGAMALGWDEANLRVVVEAHGVTEEPAPIPEIGDDASAGPDTLRVRLEPADARAFAARTRTVVAAGRAPCPFCSQPLDPEGHLCPRSNGYRRRA